MEESDIYDAAREGRVDVVESILQTNPRLHDKLDGDQRAPIHWAVANKHLAVVELLASRKTFDPDLQDGSGWTPLMMASSLVEGETIVDVLLRKQADTTVKNFNGQTALHFAASKNNLEIARKLIKCNASTRIKDKRGQLPLHRAAAIGSVPMVNLLLMHSSPLNAADITGYTSLHHAICEGHGDTAIALLKAGAEVDRRDIDGFLAIELAPDAKVRKFILQNSEREDIDWVAR